MIAQRTVMVTYEFIGFHRWPEAGQVVPARSYLADRHRHKFRVMVCVDVAHADREIEFHELLDHCAATGPVELGRRSCEDIAEDVWATVTGRWPGRTGTVEVWEDGEVGARVAFTVD